MAVELFTNIVDEIVQQLKWLIINRPKAIKELKKTELTFLWSSGSSILLTSNGFCCNFSVIFIFVMFFIAGW